MKSQLKDLPKKLRKKGLSVSRFIENLVIEQEEPDQFTPTRGTAAYELANLVSESEKLNRYNYEELKDKALKEKYGF